MSEWHAVYPQVALDFRCNIISRKLWLNRRIMALEGVFKEQNDLVYIMDKLRRTNFRPSKNVISVSYYVASRSSLNWYGIVYKFSNKMISNELERNSVTCL